MKVKQPWEMTQVEWDKAQSDASKAEIKALKSFPSSQRQAQYTWGTKARIALEYGVEARPIRRRGVPIVIHKQVIEKAIAEGKPVPVKVLREYPELKPQLSKEPFLKQKEHIEDKIRFKRLKGKEPWEIGKEDFVANEIYSYEKEKGYPPSREGAMVAYDYHYDLVKQALAEGKPVPAAILKDYPDLVKNSTAKQPWEMTREEFLQFYISGKHGASKNYETLKRGLKMTDSERYKDGLSYEAIAVSEFENTRIGYIQAALKQDRALSLFGYDLSKPVPPEVLKDYPDLQLSSKELKKVHENRSAIARSLDESRGHDKTIKQGDPNIRKWINHPGRYDVEGVDTPRKKKKPIKSKKQTKTRSKSNMGVSSSR